MKERQILFSRPMVPPVLAGTKTQTRRVVKPLPLTYSASLDSLVVDEAAMLDGRIMKLNRYGRPGDRLGRHVHLGKVVAQQVCCEATKEQP